MSIANPSSSSLYDSQPAGSVAGGWLGDVAGAAVGLVGLGVVVRPSVALGTGVAVATCEVSSSVSPQEDMPAASASNAAAAANVLKGKRAVISSPRL
jgi:hypothetical protein